MPTKKRVGRSQKTRNLEIRRDVVEIISGFSEKDQQIPDRIDSETGEMIPDEMPRWRFRMERRRKQAYEEAERKKSKKAE